MVRLKFSIGLDYQINSPGCDFIFNIHAAQTAHQTVVSESLAISQQVLSNVYTDTVFTPVTLQVSRSGRAADGQLPGHGGHQPLYRPARHHPRGAGGQPARCRAAVPLPQPLLPVRPAAAAGDGRVWPPATALHRVQAIHDWVTKRVTFQSNSSNGTTTAIDTLIDRVGVCRDFAHLMISLCRALNIPARFATGIDYGADPALGPPDFHAYVEVFLG